MGWRKDKKKQETADADHDHASELAGTTPEPSGDPPEAEESHLAQPSDIETDLAEEALTADHAHDAVDLPVDALAAAGTHQSADAPETHEKAEALDASADPYEGSEKAPGRLPHEMAVEAAPAGNTDDFAATRERVGDPDDWRLERRKSGLELSSGAQRERLEGEELAKAKKFRAIVHAATATSATLVLAALTVHLLGVRPVGIETWLITLAVGAFLGATYAFPLARFEPRLPTGAPEELAKARHVRELTMRSFGVGFGILFAIIAFLELMALLVGLRVVADLSQSQVTLAKHFVFIPSLALGTLIAATYIRMRVPAMQEKLPHQQKIVVGGYALFGVASLVALVFSLGIPAIVQATQVEARQAIYIATVSLLTALAVGNLRLGYPDVVRIIISEVERAKQVDRRSAETMHKKMLRNYILALVFVVGSIGFLVSKAAGFVEPEKSGGLDVVLLIYLGLGVLFLGTVLMHFFQAKQINKRVILPHKGKKTGLGKRRYRPEEVTRYLIIGISGFFALIFIVLSLLVAIGKLGAIGPFEVTKAHATDMGVFAVLVAIGPYGFYYAREAARIRTIDEKFPDFLRDLAESQRAGMTLPRALLTSSRGVYGPLTKEIKIMAAQVEWGVSFNDALARFAERTRTPLIQRTVSLVCEASASGGNVVDILAAASDDAREIKNILVERKQQMSVYSIIIYIAFGVFLTVITVLNSQFIPQLASSTSAVAGTSLGGIQFGVIDVPTYQRLFWHAALIQGIGGGLVSGVMTEGHPLSGLRHSFIMTAMSYITFRFIIM